MPYWRDSFRRSANQRASSITRDDRCHDDTRALAIANRAVTREDLICITGSFYLVGEAKKYFAAKQAAAQAAALAAAE